MGGQGGRRGGGRQRPPRRQKGADTPLPEGLPRWPDADVVVLARGRSGTTSAGHPWIFSGAIAHTRTPKPKEGEADAPGARPCAVFDAEGRYLGWGTHNPASQIAVRMVALEESEQPPARLPDLQQWLPDALDRAAALRQTLGLPNDDTDAFRLVNGEGDGMPGLFVDRMGDGAVALVSTAGARSWAPTVAQHLCERLGCAWVVVRTAGDAHPSETLMPGELLRLGEVPEEVQLRHHGVQMTVRPGAGQKSGLFLDQWHNHLKVAALAKGRVVIDAYCHGGGFGLHAARAGAARVLCVDASQKATEMAAHHAEINDLGTVQVQQADAVHVLQDIADGVLGPDEPRPDLVIIDPPKFVTRADVKDDALRKYAHLNATAMRALKDGGLLVSCSCSGRLPLQDFTRMLAHAARRAGCDIQLIDVWGGGPDHPTVPAHEQARYLKVALCRIRHRAPAVTDSQAAVEKRGPAWSPLDD